MLVLGELCVVLGRKSKCTFVVEFLTIILLLVLVYFIFLLTFCIAFLVLSAPSHIKWY